VLQRYVAAPLLLDRRKFHLRVYVLAVASLQIYVYSVSACVRPHVAKLQIAFLQDILALFSGVEYESKNYGNVIKFQL
jgi:hypothetical protein